MKGRVFAMLLKSITVEWFRSIAAETVTFDDITVFVGANGAGKSSFLRALEVFYGQAGPIAIDDFHNRDTSREILIAATYSDLCEDAAKQFGAYLQGDVLTVEYVIKWDGERGVGRYYGSRLQHEAFRPCRLATSAANRRSVYNALRESPQYGDLPAWRNQEGAMDSLAEWETTHPEHCVRARDEGQFFGFTEVAQGYLGRHSKYLLIPAVRDAAADAVEGRSSPISRVLDIVVRRTLEQNAKIQALEEQTRQAYKDLLNPATSAGLGELAGALTSTIQTYVPNATVIVEWNDLPDVELPSPTAAVKLSEDGFEATVERSGHGLQRAFILSLLQHLARLQDQDRDMPPDETIPGEHPKHRRPHFVLAIEEPELYQHPTRQRHLAKVLLALAGNEIPNIAERAQIVYATHSPHFVGLDRFNQVRICRKIARRAGLPGVTQVFAANLDAVAESLWQACGAPGPKFTGDSLIPRLKALMSASLAEGFFADTVVLVEGEGDKAAITTSARLLGYDFDSAGIAVLPCDGKTNLDRPALVFKSLGIPVYVIWDGDKESTGSHSEVNRRLLHIVGGTQDDWPAAIDARYAVFAKTLDDEIKEALGSARYGEWVTRLRDELKLSGKDAHKNPLLIERLLERANAEGRPVTRFNEIVNAVIELNATGKKTQGDMIAQSTP